MLSSSEAQTGPRNSSTTCPWPNWGITFSPRPSWGTMPGVASHWSEQFQLFYSEDPSRLLDKCHCSQQVVTVCFVSVLNSLFHSHFSFRHVHWQTPPCWRMGSATLISSLNASRRLQRCLWWLYLCCALPAQPDHCFTLQSIWQVPDAFWES